MRGRHIGLRLGRIAYGHCPIIPSPWPRHSRFSIHADHAGVDVSSVEISLISNMVFSHKSLHTYALHHACRTPGWAGGYISSLSKSLIAWRAHYARRGSGRCLAVSCLNQSIIWFWATAAFCRPACAVLAHNVPAGSNGSGASRRAIVSSGD